PPLRNRGTFADRSACAEDAGSPSRIDSTVRSGGSLKSVTLLKACLTCRPIAKVDLDGVRFTTVNGRPAQSRRSRGMGGRRFVNHRLRSRIAGLLILASLWLAPAGRTHAQGASQAPAPTVAGAPRSYPGGPAGELPSPQKLMTADGQAPAAGQPAPVQDPNV